VEETVTLAPGGRPCAALPHAEGVKSCSGPALLRRVLAVATTLSNLCARPLRQRGVVKPELTRKFHDNAVSPPRRSAAEIRPNARDSYRSRNGVGQVGHPLRRLAADRLQAHAAPRPRPRTGGFREPNSTGEKRDRETRRSGRRSRTPGSSRRRPRCGRPRCRRPRAWSSAVSMPSLDEVEVSRPALPGVTLLGRHDEDQRTNGGASSATPARRRRTCACPSRSRRCARTSPARCHCHAPPRRPRPSFRFPGRTAAGISTAAVPSTAAPSNPGGTRRAMNPSSDIDTLKNTFPAISPHSLPNESR